MPPGCGHANLPPIAGPSGTFPDTGNSNPGVPLVTEFSKRLTDWVRKYRKLSDLFVVAASPDLRIFRDLWGRPITQHAMWPIENKRGREKIFDGIFDGIF